jgi:hypothetical protein
MRSIEIEMLARARDHNNIIFPVRRLRTIQWRGHQPRSAAVVQASANLH